MCLRDGLISALAAFLLGSTAQAGFLSVDPNLVPSDTNISTFFPNVTLSASGTGIATPGVYAVFQNFSGLNVFGFDAGGVFDDYWIGDPVSPIFRADFTGGAQTVALTIMSDNPGTLRVYGLGNTLLGTVDYPDFNPVTFSTPGDDIYAIELQLSPGGGADFGTIQLLEVTTLGTPTAAVPAPASLGLAALGGLLLFRFRRR